ncbi:heavy metal-associated domain-containing protein [Pseudotenacibaculum sp. MALMAid0570]|uniref:heavy-metal-associated domain-containing protein n=1 Tax=Pseudotenacibaculum sp. MALMAid0570 TaxID=3143938 RepID=UPI0032DFB8BE
MKIRHILIAVIAMTFTLSSCKKEVEKTEKNDIKKEAAIAKMETVSLNISGMTCEIGCAKTIQSKLSKKEGVASAKVVFTDSLATIKYDANTTSKEDLIKFIDGIAGGDLYTAKESENTTSKK